MKKNVFLTALITTTIMMAVVVSGCNKTEPYSKIKNNIKNASKIIMFELVINDNKTSAKNIKFLKRSRNLPTLTDDDGFVSFLDFETLESGQKWIVFYESIGINNDNEYISAAYLVVDGRIFSDPIISTEKLSKLIAESVQ